MKRIAGVAFLIAVLTSGISAFADSTATYSGSTSNQVDVESITTGTYSTVLISKVSDDVGQSGSLDANSIVYIKQESSAFGAVADFLIKANPAYGKYKLQLGSSSADKETTYFYIGVDTPSGDTAMTRVGEEPDPKIAGYWNVGYIMEVPISDYNDFNSVKVSYDSVDNYIENSSSNDIKTGGYNKAAEVPAPYYKNWPSNISGSGNVKLAFQINHVPAAYKDSITVYMSNSSVSDTKLNQ